MSDDFRQNMFCRSIACLVICRTTSSIGIIGPFPALAVGRSHESRRKWDRIWCSIRDWANFPYCCLKHSNRPVHIPTSTTPHHHLTVLSHARLVRQYNIVNKMYYICRNIQLLLLLLLFYRDSILLNIWHIICSAPYTFCF